MLRTNKWDLESGRQIGWQVPLNRQLLSGWESKLEELKRFKTMIFQ
jgi:hypothetical protein